MSAEAVAAALLGVPSITSQLAQVPALIRLPQGASYPAVIYDVTGGPVSPINAAAGAQLMHARIQVTVLARDLTALIAVHAAVRAALEFQSGVIGGARVVSVLRDLVGPGDEDQDAKVFMRPVDYTMFFYDT
jgi:hypothetical protein